MKKHFGWTNKPVTWGGYVKLSLISLFASMVLAAGYILNCYGVFSMIGEKFAEWKNKLFSRQSNNG